MSQETGSTYFSADPALFELPLSGSRQRVPSVREQIRVRSEHQRSGTTIFSQRAFLCGWTRLSVELDGSIGAKFWYWATLKLQRSSGEPPGELLRQPSENALVRDFR